MSVIEDIKGKLDIVEVISQHLPLQKAGRNFKALCPFHTEKTPSFYVFPEQGSWHCFGCSTGGDLFTFVMKMERLEFRDALRTLAERAGVPLTSKPADDAVQKETQKLRELNQASAMYYHNLLVNSSAAAGAREYLAGRGISAQTISDFQLGFSPPSWDSLRGYLLERGHTEEDLLAAGLVVGREDGAPYDRFRNRLVIPIRDPQGRGVGFGARALDDSLPKYINSPQTAIFDKGSLLYGLDRARDAIRREDSAVIVEGYMDVLVAHQHGFENVVATMGTALTDRQLSAIKGLTKNIILALDADAAGDMAAVRGVEVARQALRQEMIVPAEAEENDLIQLRNVLGGEIRVMTLPRGKDPDEVIRESPELWRRLVGEALPVIDFMLKATASQLDLDSPQDKSAAVDRMLPVIHEVEDHVQRAHYRQKLARLVGIDERDLPHRAPPRKSWGSRLEEYCLALLLQHPELREQASALSLEHFTKVENREVFAAWRDGGEGQEVRRRLDPTRRRHLSALRRKALGAETPGGWQQALAESMQRLEERRLGTLKRKEKYLIEESSGRNFGQAVQASPIEEYCLALLLRYSELREHASELTPQHFTDVKNREIFVAWLAGEDEGEMRRRLETVLHSHLEHLLSKTLPPEPSGGWGRGLAQATLRLEERRLKTLKLQEEYLIEEAESEAGAADLARRSFDQWQHPDALDESEASSNATALQLRGLELNIRLRQLFAKALQKNNLPQGLQGGDEE